MPNARKRVLVVDDEPLVVKSLEALLSLEGDYEIMGFTSCRTALESGWPGMTTRWRGTASLKVCDGYTPSGARAVTSITSRRASTCRPRNHQTPAGRTVQMRSTPLIR